MIAIALKILTEINDYTTYDVMKQQEHETRGTVGIAGNAIAGITF